MSQTIFKDACGTDQESDNWPMIIAPLLHFLCQNHDILALGFNWNFTVTGT